MCKSMSNAFMVLKKKHFPETSKEMWQSSKKKIESEGGKKKKES